MYKHGEGGSSNWGGTTGSEGSNGQSYYQQETVAPITGMGGIMDNDPAIKAHLGENAPIVGTGFSTNNTVTETVVPTMTFVSEDYITKEIKINNDLLENTAVKIYKMNEESLIRCPVMYVVEQKKLIVTTPDFTIDRFKQTLQLKTGEAPFNAKGWLDTYIVQRFSKEMNKPYVGTLKSFVKDFKVFKKILTTPGTVNITDATKSKVKTWLINLEHSFEMKDDELYVKQRVMFIFNSDETLYTELRNAPIEKLLATPQSFLYQLMKHLKVPNGITVVVYSAEEERSWVI
ncbi:MAG: hypothetical protein DRP93_01240 [Candidatus Neomarinimicrobiota bacterium]|nr:MAG: hypothetical protein DRP93_01240 [Candidatus Neomarinimicrobiota bacterium]